MDGNETVRSEEYSAQIESLQSELSELSAKNATLQNSLDNALSEVAVADCVKEDLFELDRQRNALEDEKKTLESLLTETRDEVTSTRTRYEHECARMKAVNEQLELENRELKIHHSKFGTSEMLEGNGNLVDKETLSVITDATKSLARRVKSNLMSGAGGSGTVSFNKFQSHPEKSDDSDTSPVNHDPTGIQKASEDAELLKAIVVPLEEQIVALKEKIRETDTMLRQFEMRQSSAFLSSEALAPWLSGRKSLAEAIEDLEKRHQEIVSQSESSDLTDLMLTSLLNTRLAMVIKELTELRVKNDRCTNDLEQSMNKCADLRSQAAEANGRLLRSQQKHASELGRVTLVLTEEQKLVLSTQRRNSTSDQNSSEISLMKSNSVTSGNSVSDEIVISRSEWDSLQCELDKLRALMGLGLDVDVVGSDQFKELQAQLQESRAKAEKQTKREETLQSEMEVMEQQWNQRAEEHQSQTSELVCQINQSQKLLSLLQNSHQIALEESKARLHKLSSDRERIVNELKRLQIENDELLGKHNAKADEIQSEVINLPEKTDDMHLLLLTYRDQLISAKIAAEHHEEKRRQVSAELTAETETLKERLLLMESCQSELEAVQKRSLEIEMTAKNLQNEKTRLEKELENSAMQRARADGQVSEYKARISNLQQELDNSVAVQTDFVRLSQSLQMELEKIRQSEKEVRWQHEDDSEDCSSCRQQFNMAKRKHHCRHCGRIFCADCLTKTVTSGPQNRPSKVCEVCHTLLVQNSAPYFSTVVPSISDGSGTAKN